MTEKDTTRVDEFTRTENAATENLMAEVDKRMTDAELDQVAGGALADRTYIFGKNITSDGQPIYIVSYLSEVPGYRSSWLHKRIYGEEAWEQFRKERSEAKFIELGKTYSFK